MNHGIFFDIDGTIIHAGQNPTEEIVQAIRAARKAGNHVFLSTGRAEHAIPQAVQDIGFDGGIYSAGGRVVVHDTVILDHTMPKQLLSEILQVFQREGLFFVLECLHCTFFSGTDVPVPSSLCAEQINSELKRLLQMRHDPNQKPLEQYAGEPVYKICFTCTSPEQKERVSRLLAHCGKINFFGSFWKDMSLYNGEISDASVDKGTALSVICSHLHIAPEQCIAFGDSSNDMEILRAAGLGIVVDNATDDVKQIADMVCESCMDNGVAKALKRLKLTEAE